MAMKDRKRQLTVDTTVKKLKSMLSAKTTKNKTKTFRSVSSSEARACMHTYHEQTTPSAAIGVEVVDTVYRGNGMYDPTYALGGTQPFGFDQLTPLYRKYYVKQSRIRAEGMNYNLGSATDGVPRVFIAVWADTNPTAPPNAKVAFERCAANHGTWERIGVAQDRMKPVKREATTIHLLKSGMTEDNNHGTSATDPAEQWFWHVCMINEDRLIGTSPQLEVDIEYDAIWTESILNIGS